MRFLDLAIALGFVVSPVFYVLAKRRARRARWYPTSRALINGDERIGVQRDTLRGPEFLKVADIDPGDPEYDQRYSEFWAQAKSSADTHNATLRRRKRR